MNTVQIFKHSSISTAFDSYQAFTTSAVPTDTNRYIIISEADANSVKPDDVGKYSVFDIANWFLSKGEMTHKKLQKLCYYAQAWCYALKDYRLENTDFQAWVHGPVSPALWERFKSFGYDPIRIKGNLNITIDEDDIKLLEDVWDTYGDYSGNALEILTHKEMPWIEARKGYNPDERCTVVISPAIMKSYYQSIYDGE